MARNPTSLSATDIPFPRPTDNDRDYLRRHQDQVASLPLHDRQQARSDYSDLLCNPDQLADNVYHLLAGNYGCAQLWEAWDATLSNRRNHCAVIGSLLALSMGRPPNFARQAYNGLTKDQQKAVDATIDRVIVDLADAWLLESMEE